MKFSLSLALLAALLIPACSDVEEPPVRHRVARYPAQEEYPLQQQPFNPNAPPQPENVPPQETAAAPASTAVPTQAQKGDHPYGIPVPGKPHVVESPYSPGKYVDVEGFPPGTEVKDPYTGKIFLVP
jgi:biotin carboxyl carrier protein